MLKEAEQPASWLTVEEIKTANQAKGKYFFSSNTMEMFGTEVHDEVFGGRIIVIADRNFDDTAQEWKLVYCHADGDCDYLPGDDWPTTRFEHRGQAVALALRIEAGKPEVLALDYNAGVPCSLELLAAFGEGSHPCGDWSSWSVDDKPYCYRHTWQAIQAGWEKDPDF